MNELRQKLIGYYHYYGVTDNSVAINKFQWQVRKLLYKWLNRRSQKKSFNYEKFQLFLGRYPLPKPRIYVNIYAIRPRLAGCRW